MKTKEQIKQGCKEWYGFLNGYQCGNNGLCPTCQALLEQIEDFEKKANDLLIHVKGFNKYKKVVWLIENFIEELTEQKVQEKWEDVGE